VEFKVNPTPDYLINLENEIIKRLGITKAFIVPSGSTLQESKENVARMAARFLETSIKDGMIIGLSWGSTIQLTAKYYKNRNSFPFPNTVFVQLSGSLCSRPILGDGYIDGNIFVQQLAAKANAEWSLFNVPYIVQNPSLKELLYEEPQVNSHVQLFKKLDMALVGLGAVDSSKSVSYISGYLTYEETKKLADDNMAADLCGTRLTPNGEIKETFLTNRVLTIDLMDLYNLKNVCAVGAGAEKAHSFIAGCHGGFIKFAIMDEVCALTIMSKTG
jgi:DNA-binding transcriptional regulator LsrR (DeoR family)